MIRLALEAALNVVVEEEGITVAIATGLREKHFTLLVLLKKRHQAPYLAG